MSSKAKVLVSSPYYLPGFKAGGALRTIVNTIDLLGAEIDFYIITSDRDSGMKQPYLRVDLETWSEVNGAKVFYVNQRALTFHYWYRFLNDAEYDVLYLNSLFSPVFSLKPVFLAWLGLLKNKNIVLAPRGELSKGALSIRSRKKSTFLRLAKFVGLYDGVNFQASADVEKDDIVKVFGDNAYITVAQDPVAPLPMEENGSLKKEKGDLKLVFLSRVSPVKNLKGALQFLVKSQRPCVLEVYGPISDIDYWNDCLRTISDMPDTIQVEYKGVINNRDLGKVFTDNHFFFLPTLGENFGHVIYESLSYGCPVIISDRTIWRNLKDAGVGWDVDIDHEEAMLNVIREAFDMDQGPYSEMRKACRVYAQKLIHSSPSLKDTFSMLDAYREAM